MQKNPVEVPQFSLIFGVANIRVANNNSKAGTTFEWVIDVLNLFRRLLTFEPLPPAFHWLEEGKSMIINGEELSLRKMSHALTALQKDIEEDLAWAGFDPTKIGPSLWSEIEEREKK